MGGLSSRQVMLNQLGKGVEGWHLPGTACQPAMGSFHSPGMGLAPIGKTMATALWPQWPQVLLPKNHLPSLVLPVNHGRPCPCPRQPCRERAVLDMYIKRRIKPGSSIAPDLWLHQPWEGGRNFFPFLIPPQHSFPGPPCRAAAPCRAAGLQPWGHPSVTRAPSHLCPAPQNPSRVQ